MLSAAFRLPAAVERTSLDSDGGVAGWRLLPQDEVRDARAMMEAGYDVSEWIPAVVPGAVFTSYVEAGIEPDPNFGDNAYRADRKKYDRNFWYRTELATEELPAGGHCWLCFEGANRRAEVYFNGERLGGLDGFMDRGRFEEERAGRAGPCPEDADRQPCQSDLYFERRMGLDALCPRPAERHHG